MAVDKLVDSGALDNALDYTADRIRLKTGGSSDIAFDLANEKGFGDAVDAIPSGGEDLLEKFLAGSNFTYENASITSLDGGPKRITSLKIPNCTSINGGILGGLGCTVLALPSLASVSGYQHFGSSSIQTLDIGPNFTQIKNMMTQNNYSLSTLILRRSSGIVSIDSTSELNSNAFKNGGSGGTVYIPKALYDHLGDGTSLDYKAATNWSTVDGYGTITWAQIEGSQYENYYADGTPVT